MTTAFPKARKSVTLTSLDVCNIVGKENGLPQGHNVEWKLISDATNRSFELILSWEDPATETKP